MPSNKRRSGVHSSGEASEDSVIEFESSAKAKFGEPPTSNALSSTDYTWQPSEIPVGTYKECRKVQVFAKLTRCAGTPTVLFKIDVPTANDVSKIQFYKEKISYDQIKFAPEFGRGTAQEIKAYIRTKFTKVPKTELSFIEPSKELERGSIVDSDTWSGIDDDNEPKNLSPEPPELFLDNPSKRTSDDKRESSVAAKALSSLGDIYSAFDRHMLDGVRTARDAVEDMVVNMEGELNLLNDKNKAQGLIIAEYKRSFGTLDNPLPKTSNAKRTIAPSLPESVPRPVTAPHLSMRGFETVVKRSNSGFLQEKQALRVNYDGNWYEERIIVEELQRYKAPGEFHGTTQIGGRAFTTFRHQGGSFKHLHQPSPGEDSIATSDCGRMFAKWTLLKPLTDAGDFEEEISESPLKTISSYASDY